MNKTSKAGNFMINADSESMNADSAGKILNVMGKNL